MFGFVIGMFTMFIGAAPGAILGYIAGFIWGYKRVGDTAHLPQPGSASDVQNTGNMPATVGDTAFLAVGFFGFVWLSIALPNLLFGFSGPYKGHWLGLLLPLLGFILSPFAAIVAQRQARRKFESRHRDAIGIAVLIIFLLAVAVWWRWAEARDEATSRRLYPARIKR